MLRALLLADVICYAVQVAAVIQRPAVAQRSTVRMAVAPVPSSKVEVYSDAASVGAALMERVEEAAAKAIV